MTWHTNEEMLRDYTGGALGAAHAASVEAHLTECADCRATIATLVDRPRLDRSWTAIADRLDDGGSAAHVERVLRRVGIAEHRVHLVTTTPALRSPSLVGVLAVLFGVSLLNALDSGDPSNVFVFLVLAPLLPIVGVAVAFGSIGDPGRELVASTPTPAFELLLVRTVAVVAATTVLTALASLLLPFDWHAIAWLLPSLGLTAAVLALATWVPAHWAALSLGVAWVSTAGISWRVNRVDPDVLSRFVALRPAGQALFAAIAIAGAVIVVLRREALDLRRFA